MAKRPLSTTEATDLRNGLQVVVLQALVSARRWGPGDLVFQGGTSLHLCHGSPRFSEDLDFLVRSTIDLHPLAAAVSARIPPTSLALPREGKISVTAARDGKNPHAFAVSIGGERLLGAVRVKVELWQAPAEVLKPLVVQIAPIRLLSGPAAGAQAFVPAASLHEIYADKVFALAARSYLKARDVFDLHWLLSREPGLRCSQQDLRLRLATYPDATPAGWLAKADERAAQLRASHQAVAQDLARWLPSFWPLGDAEVSAMIAAADAALAGGVAQMTALAAGAKDERLGA